MGAGLGQQLVGGPGGLFTDLTHLGPEAGKPCRQLSADPDVLLQLL
jgi:hypothetical protein